MALLLLTGHLPAPPFTVCPPCDELEINKAALPELCPADAALFAPVSGGALTLSSGIAASTPMALDDHRLPSPLSRVPFTSVDHRVTHLALPPFSRLVQLRRPEKAHLTRLHENSPQAYPFTYT